MRELGLNYKSINKFLISLGVALIIAPLAILFIIINKEIPLISIDDYNRLSQFSIKLLLLQTRIYKFLSSNGMLITLLFIFIIGIALTTFGIIKWYKKANRKDDVIQESQDSFSKTKVKSENNELNIRDRNSKKNSNIKFKPIDYEELEKECYDYVIKKYSKYKFFKYCKVGTSLYLDFIGKSVEEDYDLIFEVKAYMSIKLTNPIKLLGYIEAYRNATGRDAKLILITKAPKNKIFEIKDNFDDLIRGYDSEIELVCI